MNTDPKNNEPVQGLQLHPEHTASDTNPHSHAVYEVTVYLTQYRVGTVIVEAASEEEAREKAATAEIDGGKLLDVDIEVGAATRLDRFDPDCEDLDWEGGCDE